MGFLGAATGAQAAELGLQIAPRLADGGPSALHQRRRVERRLPALSSLRGHRPAHERRCPAVGKRLMSMPISETMIRLASAPTPGIAVRFCAAARKGARLASTSWSI